MHTRYNSRTAKKMKEQAWCMAIVAGNAILWHCKKYSSNCWAVCTETQLILPLLRPQQVPLVQFPLKHRLKNKSTYSEIRTLRTWLHMRSGLHKKSDFTRSHMAAVASSKANVKLNTLPRTTRDIPSRAGNRFRPHCIYGNKSNSLLGTFCP